MNEQLQTTVNEILVRSLETFDKGSEWLAGEVPEVVEQLLLWHMIESLIIMSIGVALFLSLFKVIPVILNELSKPFIEHSDITVNIGFIYSFIVVIVAPVMIFFNLTWIKILIAPKLYLLEYAADLVK